MKDERHISRRASLKGIAAAGALVGGSFVGVSSVSAGDEKSNGVDRVEFEKCRSLAIYFDRDYVKSKAKSKKPLATVCVRLHNEDPSPKQTEIENYRTEITAHDLYKRRKKDKKGDGHAKAWWFDVVQFYDRPKDIGDKILSVSIDGERIVNPSDCAGKYPNADYDRKKTDEIDTDDIYVKARGAYRKGDLARYQVVNKNKKPATVAYKVDGEKGHVEVEGESTTYFDVVVPDSDGDVELDLYFDGERIAKGVRSDEYESCIPTVNFFASCVKPEKKRGWFVVNSFESDLEFVYRVDETGEWGTFSAESGISKADSVWIDLPKGKQTVTLFYEGRAVGRAFPKNAEHCD